MSEWTLLQILGQLFGAAAIALAAFGAIYGYLEKRKPFPRRPVDRRDRDFRDEKMSDDWRETH